MRTLASIAAIGAALVLPLAAAPAAYAEDETVVVDENGDGDWLFNRDVTTSSPYEFTTDEASIGMGSLSVLPIGPNAADKFIAEQDNPDDADATPDRSADDLQSISYDFLIAGNGTPADANEFYLNVYTNLPGQSSTNFYDCRFDYTPDSGSITDFTTASFDRTDEPTRVAARGGATCPATLDELPEGSTINFFAISVGDSSANDTGLAGYYDNVVVENTDGSTVTFDFEPKVAKDDCKKGGYEAYGFKNQGQCVAYANANG